MIITAYKAKFKYVKNEAFLHTDKNLMPKKKRAWSSWNSITKGDKTCITYWLNKLQNLNTSKNYFLKWRVCFER